jgi:hypothetical protein
MRAWEFITEGRTGSFTQDVALALPGAWVIPELKNSDPYFQYRFGVAIAAAKGAAARKQDAVELFSKQSVFGENEIVVSYDPKTGEYIDAALAQMGMHGKKQIATMASEEMPDVVKTSPVKGFKGYPR